MGWWCILLKIRHYPRPTRLTERIFLHIIVVIRVLKHQWLNSALSVTVKLNKPFLKYIPTILPVDFILYILSRRNCGSSLVCCPFCSANGGMDECCMMFQQGGSRYNLYRNRDEIWHLGCSSFGLTIVKHLVLQMIQSEKRIGGSSLKKIDEEIILLNSLK